MSTSFAASADLHVQALLSQVTEGRKRLGLTQAELAERIGVDRMTVQRNETEGANPKLSNFVAAAVALNMVPTLRGADADHVVPDDLVHRGYAHARTQLNPDWRDRQREKALAKGWQAVNEPRRHGFSATLPQLVPSCTQDQASACATVIQWLGSEVGFQFLQEVLNDAGYAVVDQAGAVQASGAKNGRFRRGAKG